MDLYDFTVPQFKIMLNNVLGVLDKAVAHAEAKKYDVKNVLNARLAPDQFSFIRQVQIACDTAKGAAARLSGQEPPRHEDYEQTVEELRARVRKTLDFLATVSRDHFSNAETRMIAIPWMPGKGLSGREFVLRMAVPNLYFHVTTAYSILRHNGIDLGKSDYLGPIEMKGM